MTWHSPTTKTWTFSPGSKLIRFYLWAWPASASRLNFCKLFWGTVLAPIGVFLGLCRMLANKLPEPAPKPRKHKDHDFLDRVSHRVDRGVGFLQRHGKIFLGLWYGILGAYALTVLTFVVIAFVNHFWHTLLIAGLCIAGLALIFGAVWLFLGTNFGKFLHTGYKSVKTRTCPVIKIEGEEIDEHAHQHAF